VASRGEPATDVLARIALLSDTHTLAVTNARQAAYKANLSRAAEQVNAAKVDLVLIAGDLTESGKVEEMKEFRAQLKQFTAPVWFVPGNHDVGNKREAAKPPVVTKERVELFTRNLGPSYFNRLRAGIRVIGINASLLESELPEEIEMWKWLEQQLKETSGRPVLLLSHYPPFLKAADEPGGDYYNMPLAARSRLLALMRQGRIQVVLSGHYHRPLVNHVEGHLLLTTPPISFGLPKGKTAEGWTLVTVRASGEVGYEFRALKRSED
jgi:3',5'-cyclic AMP phosphodiesterase CpdA